MSRQAVDKNGAADFLGISTIALNRRINAKQFPEPDSHHSANSPDSDWWTLDTLDRYQRDLAKKTARARKRAR